MSHLFTTVDIGFSCYFIVLLKRCDYFAVLLFPYIFTMSYFIQNCFWSLQEIDDLCDEWVPEPLIPPIAKDMLSEPPVLER